MAHPIRQQDVESIQFLLWQQQQNSRVQQIQIPQTASAQRALPGMFSQPEFGASGAEARFVVLENLVTSLVQNAVGQAATIEKLEAQVSLLSSRVERLAGRTYGVIQQVGGLERVIRTYENSLRGLKGILDEQVKSLQAEVNRLDALILQRQSQQAFAQGPLLRLRSTDILESSSPRGSSSAVSSAQEPLSPVARPHSVEDLSRALQKLDG